MFSIVDTVDTVAAVVSLPFNLVVRTANDASREVIASASALRIGTGAEQMQVACVAPLHDGIVASLPDLLPDFLVGFY